MAVRSVGGVRVEYCLSRGSPNPAVVHLVVNSATSLVGGLSLCMYACRCLDVCLCVCVCVCWCVRLSVCVHARERRVCVTQTTSLHDHGTQLGYLLGGQNATVAAVNACRLVCAYALSDPHLPSDPPTHGHTDTRTLVR